LVILRYLFLCLLKIVGRLIYPSKIKWITKRPDDLNEISLILILNHTSLLEFIYCIILPFSYLWQLSKRSVFPIAEKTLKKPFYGFMLSHIAPKTISLTRKRDESWLNFLNQIKKDDICVFLPEGQMKRKTGFDKYGKKMVVKKGVYDILLKYRNKSMAIVYSGGLHHILAPEDHYPRIFKKIFVKVECLKVNDYLKIFEQEELVIEKITQDLQRRRDLHC
jgi:hypothetical protein